MKRFFKDWFSFSHGERKGVLCLVVLVIALLVTPLCFKLFRTQETSQTEMDKLRQYAQQLGEAASSQYDQLGGESKEYGSAYNKSEPKTFAFDPNTISHDSLMLLGFSLKQADAIIKYRERGWTFRNTDDFFKLYVITDKQKERLRSYVAIAPRPDKQAFSRDTFPRKTYTAKTPVELNSADTAQLNALPGVGKYLSQKIVEYRETLGGYTSLDQLLEIRYFDAEKLQRLAPRLTIDLQQVKKFELSETSLEQMRRHPYVGAYAARGIIQFSKRKGSPATLDELVQNNILASDKAQKLKPYIK